MVGVMEEDRLTMLSGLDINQDHVCSWVATLVVLVSDRATQVGSLSVMCVAGMES
jgi:hypothetical protein